MKLLFFTALLAGNIYAQTFTAGPLVQVSTTNLFADCNANTPGFVANSEVEPWLAVNPANTNNLIGVWQQDRFSDGGSRGNIVGASFDGGATWQSVFINDTVLCDGGGFQRATDPWVSFSPDGTAHLIVLAFEPDSGSGFGANAMLASRSVDGGMTWSTPVTLISTSDPGTLNDKESITADPTDANFVYAVWDRLQPFRNNPNSFTGPTLFARSTDGGVTWEPARVINNTRRFQQTIGNQIVVRPDGTLLNFSTAIRARRSNKARNRIQFQTSTDHGLTWSRPRRGIRTQPHSAFSQFGVFEPQSHAALRTEDILPAVAVDPVSGTLYVAWQDSRFSGHTIDQIAFSQSTNGRRWSRPVRIDQNPASGSTGQAFNPSIRVAGDGTVCVTYYDFRNTQADVWAVFSTPPGSWGNEVRLTDVSFDYLRAPNAEGFFLGDYQGLASDGRDFLAFFAQTHGSDPGSIFFRRLSR